MVIRDRGKIKWAPAHFAPEHRSSLGGLKADYYRVKKPIIDECQFNEFDQRICYTMEFNLAVKIKTWQDGYTYEETGRVHFVEPIGKEVRLKTGEGGIMRIKFADIIAVEVIE